MKILQYYALVNSLLTSMNEVIICIRLIVSTDGVESSVNATVKHGQTLSELNAKYFASHSSTHTIRWIYYGRALSDSIPESVSMGSVIHVYVLSNALPAQFHPRMIYSRSARNEAHEEAQPRYESGISSQRDKFFIMFMHAVFILVLAYFWNDYRLNPWRFERLSLILLAAFSVIVTLSTVSNLR